MSLKGKSILFPSHFLLPGWNADMWCAILILARLGNALGIVNKEEIEWVLNDLYTEPLRQQWDRNIPLSIMFIMLFFNSLTYSCIYNKYRNTSPWVFPQIFHMENSGGSNHILMWWLVCNNTFNFGDYEVICSVLLFSAFKSIYISLIRIGFYFIKPYLSFNIIKHYDFADKHSKMSPTHTF